MLPKILVRKYRSLILGLVTVSIVFVLLVVTMPRSGDGRFVPAQPEPTPDLAPPTAVAAATAVAPPLVVDTAASSETSALPPVENRGAERPATLPTPLPSDRAAEDGSSQDSALRRSLEAAVAKLNGRWGIGVENLATREQIIIDADRPYPAASQYKLVELYVVSREIASGNLARDQMTRMLESDYVDSIYWDEELKIGDRVSVAGLLRVMVIQSSNAASHALFRLSAFPSTASALNQGARELGLAATRTPPGGGTVTSVTDLMLYYRQLYHGSVISNAASAAMLDLLRAQQINDRIPALLPKGVRVAHKTGNLPGVVNDGGIIFGERQDVTLVVLSEGADYEEGTAAIATIGRLVYDWYNR